MIVSTPAEITNLALQHEYSPFDRIQNLQVVLWK